MAITVYDSFDLIGVLESLENPPRPFFRDRYFPMEITSDSEKILFDVVDKKRRLAPFVSPLVEGKVMKERGYTTNTFEPPYLKPKAVIDPNKQFKRRAGEGIGGTLSPEQRRDAAVAQALMEHDEAITMREEVMCSEALRLGQVTVTGEGYGTIVLAFGRHANLTVTLTGAARWGEATGTPLTNIETWAAEVRLRSGGAIVRDVTCAPDAFAALLSRLTDAQKTQLFDSRRGSTSSIELGPRTAEKYRFEGTIGQFNFWTYSETYQDEAGVDQDVMPSGSVVLAGPDIEGTRCYGAIRDVRNLRAVRSWPKMWEEPDPSVEYLMTQSAPLMVPLRPDASFGAEVLNGGA